MKFSANAESEIKSTHRRSDFTRAKREFHIAKAIFHPPVRVDLAEKDGYFRNRLFHGVGNGTRTHNAWNHNPVLCQLNYTHHIQFAEWHARRDSFNQGSAPSSRRRQRSSALHLILRVTTTWCKIGTPGGTRTPDLLLRRQLLYPAELLAHFYGAGDGNRTRVSSLEGWCSTIELHPQIRQSWLIQL